MRLTLLFLCAGLLATACSVSAAEVADAPRPAQSQESSVDQDSQDSVAANSVSEEAAGGFCQAAEAAFKHSELIDGVSISGPGATELVEYSRLVHEAAVLAPPEIAEFYEMFDAFTAIAASDTPGAMDPAENQALFAGLPAAAGFVQAECGFDMMEDS